MDRKKELKELYKTMKSDMGVFIIRNKSCDKCYVEGAQDLKGAMNGAKFKLNFGNHPVKELQKEWAEYGEDAFGFEILETLQYDADETKTDYSEDLMILKIIWEEKLSGQNKAFYLKLK